MAESTENDAASRVMATDDVKASDTDAACVTAPDTEAAEPSVQRHASVQQSATTDETSDAAHSADEGWWGAVRRGWRRARERWWSRWLIDLAILAGIVAAVFAFQTRHLIDDGEPAPEISLNTLDGGQLDLADYRGKKVVLAFWAPWCGVCDMEASTLNDVHESALESGDAAVVSVALGYEDVASVEAFVEAHDVRFPVLLGTAETARHYNVDSFPTLYILDEEGRVEHTAVGYTTSWGIAARLW